MIDSTLCRSHKYSDPRRGADPRNGSTSPQRRARIRSIYSFALLLLLPAVLPAQQRVDPVAIGMGKASVATARGLSALGSNVGALGLDALGVYDSLQSVELDIAVLPIGAVAGSTYLTPGDLNFVFDSKDSGVFTDEDRLRLATLLESGRLSADAAVDLFDIRLRVPRVLALGVRYGHRVRAHMLFPENFRTGVLGSGDVFSKDQRFENPEIGGEWTRNLTFSLASAWERPNNNPGSSFWFPAFGVGMSIAYLEGIVHFDVDPKSWAETHVIASPPGESYRSIAVEGAYTFRTSEPLDSTFDPSDAILNSGLFGAKEAAGSGWEGSFGMSVVVLRKVKTAKVEIEGSPLEAQQLTYDQSDTRDALLFGLSVEGLGSLEWDGMNRERRYPDIRDTLNDSRGGIDNNVIYRYEAKLDTIGVFRTQLPTTLRVGVGADITAFIPSIPGDMLASLETAFDLNHAIGGERRTRVSLGAEWRPSRIISLRSGLQLGGRVDAAMAFGVGFRPVSWFSVDVATSELTSLFFADRRRLDLALGAAIHVRF